MIVLKFKAPNGEVGFTEASNSRNAMEMAKAYKQAGYSLICHYQYQ